MGRRVGTTGSTVWWTDSEPDEPVLVVYPEGQPEKVRLLGTVVALSNGGFRFDPVTAAVDVSPLPSDHLRRRGLWNDPGSGRFARRGWSTAKALAARLLGGGLIRDAAKSEGSVSARLRDDVVPEIGLARGAVVAVRFENDKYGRVVIPGDGGRTRSYRVAWDRLSPVDDQPVAAQPVSVVADQVVPEGVPDRPETPSDPVAARERALELLAGIPDDPFRGELGVNELTAVDRERLDVILEAGRVLWDDFQRATAAAKRARWEEEFSVAGLTRQVERAAAAEERARVRFHESRDVLRDFVVASTGLVPTGPLVYDDDQANTFGDKIFMRDDSSLYVLSVRSTPRGKTAAVRLERVTDERRWRKVKIGADIPYADVSNDAKIVLTLGKKYRRSRIKSTDVRKRLAASEDRALFASRDEAEASLREPLRVLARQLASATPGRGFTPDAVRLNGPIMNRGGRLEVGISLPYEIALDGGLTNTGTADLTLVIRPTRGTFSVSKERGGLAGDSRHQRLPIDDRVRDAVDAFIRWDDAGRVLPIQPADSSTDVDMARAWAAVALDAGSTAAARPMADAPSGRKTHRMASTLVERVSTLIPRSIVEAINERGAPLVVRNAPPHPRFAGSYHETADMGLEGPHHGISLIDEDDSLSTALHEYGHFLEYRIIELGRMNWAFYQHRTQGDPLVGISSVPSARGRPDAFYDVYAGRDYGSGTLRYQPPGSQGREVFTMGLEGVFAPSSGKDSIDDEHAAFVLGALALLSRRSSDDVFVRAQNDPRVFPDDAIDPSGDYRERTIAGANLSDRDLATARFDGATLEDVKFRRSRLSSASFRKATLNKVDFVGASLEGEDEVLPSFSGAHLNLTGFDDLDLSDVSFSGATIWNSSFRGTSLSSNWLEGTNVMRSYFDGAVWEEPLLEEGASWQDVSFVGASIVGGFLKFDGLRDATFDGADLRGTTLIPGPGFAAFAPIASFDGVDVRGANLEALASRWGDVDLSTVIWDETTQWGDLPDRVRRRLPPPTDLTAGDRTPTEARLLATRSPTAWRAVLARMSTEEILKLLDRGHLPAALRLYATQALEERERN